MRLSAHIYNEVSEFKVLADAVLKMVERNLSQNLMK